MVLDALKYISAKEYYQEYFGNSDVIQSCPFHEDSRPSFGYNPETGKALCRSTNCGVKFPHVVAFHARLKGINDKQAAVDIWESQFRIFEPENRIRLLTENLKNHPLSLRAFRKVRSLLNTTIVINKIGFDEAKKRFTIPVYLSPDYCVGIRYYLPRVGRTHRPNEPKLYHDKGLPDILFGGWRITSDLERPVYWLSSELDAILAQQDGYLAVASTRGEGHYNDRWASYFQHRRVGVGMGNDCLHASEKLFNWLRTIEGCKPFIVQWPASKISKDYTEYRQSGEIDKGWLGTQSGLRSEAPLAEATELLSLSKAVRVEHLNHPILLRAIINGLNYESYALPTVLEALFYDRQGNKCSAEINLTDPKYHMHFAKKPIAAQELVAKRILQGQYNKQRAFEVVPKNFVNLYECLLTPDVGAYDEHEPYSQCVAYSVNDLPIPNTRYELAVTPVANPYTQATTLVATKLTPLTKRHAGTTTVVINDLLETGSCLRCKSVEEIETLMEKLNADLSNRITGITKRSDLHILNLLTYLSPLYFTMEGRTDHRGWLECLVLGDSRTGKSETSARIQQLMQAGETLSSENCSYMGLIGGIMKQKDSTMLVWGRLPRNDEGLLVVEELSSFHTNDISKTTDVRSSGKARIDKGGHSYETFARTRQIYLSNPRGGHSLSRFPNAIPAIQALVGANEDIARFDIILVQAADELSIEQINSFLSNGSRESCTPFVEDKHWPLHVSFVWGLRPHHTVLTEKAERCARELSQSLSKEFHGEVPIFKPEDGRYKLARLASALAGITLSANKEGTGLRVKSFHIKAAERLLRRIWTKPSFGYDRFSKECMRGEQIDETKVRQVLVHTCGLDRVAVFADMLRDRTTISSEDLSECASLDRQGATHLLQELNRHRVIRRAPHVDGVTRTYYTIVPEFRKLLQKL